MILDSSVGQVRVCVFPASWQGATMRQTHVCKEKQRGQGVGKTRNRAGSAVTQSVSAIEGKKARVHVAFQTKVSGQLRKLG